MKQETISSIWRFMNIWETGIPFLVNKDGEVEMLTKFINNSKEQRFWWQDDYFTPQELEYREIRWGSTPNVRWKTADKFVSE